MPDRRSFLTATTATLGVCCVSGLARAETQKLQAARAEWIWFPGQLAAYRHKRRIRLAVERCAHVGYPANFRQPEARAFFRMKGLADRDITLKWWAPVGRVFVTTGGRGRDITDRQMIFRKGVSDIVVQIDFADSLPCILIDGENFSTGPSWEASLDGLTWRPVETAGLYDPLQLPDAEREEILSLPVRKVVPNKPPQTSYKVRDGQDLVVDFQETELGYLRFAVKGQGKLHVQVGESVAEVRDPDPRHFEQNPLAPIDLTADARIISMPERALRYARLTTTGQAEVTQLRFDAKMWPVEQKGRFECSDPELNAIWNTAVATLLSNMHDFYLDGIRRDGLVWHDGPLSLEACERVFFDADLSRQTLAVETLPEKPSVRDIGIIDSQMYDVIGFDTEYRMRGDAGFSQLFSERIIDILDFYISLQDEIGFVDARRIEPYGFFPDWSANKRSGPDAKGIPAYGQMLLAGAFAAGGRLAAAWGDRSRADRYGLSARMLRTEIRKQFLEPSSGLYRNGIDSQGKVDNRVTSFAQGYAVAFDIAEKPEYRTLFSFLSDETKRPGQMSLSQVVELAAFAKAGQVDAGIARLKSCWLPMLQRGYRRFFEDIDPAKDQVEELAMYGRPYGNSLCHIWAGAAPVLLLSKGVLGIEPIDPGYRKFSVRPHTAGLKSGQGSVPTPYGPISVEWTGRSATVRVPEGTSAHLPDGKIGRGGRASDFAI